MYISCLIGFIIITLYCSIIWIKDKTMPNSISQTVYSLSDRWNWVFTAAMFVVAFMIVPQLMTVAATNGCEFLAYLTIVGILGVGADPLDKNRKNTIHYMSAILMGISSQMLVYIINPYLFFTWIPYVIYTLYVENGKKNMFVGEMSMYSNTALLCLI